MSVIAALRLWARADGPGRMWVELAQRGRERRGRVVRGPVRLRGHRLHGSAVRRGPAPRRRRAVSGVVRGRARQPWSGRGGQASPRPEAHREQVRFVWSGDCAGQGWGINPDWGGMRGFEAMRQERPDFFVFSGDTVYADGPLLAEVPLPDGTVWRNVVTPEKSQGRRDPRRVPRPVALQPARRQPPPLQRRGARHRPVGRPRGHQQLVPRRDPHDDGRSPLHREVASTCSRRERSQAFHEYFPMTPQPARAGAPRDLATARCSTCSCSTCARSEDPNTPGLETAGPTTAILGAEQLAWLQRELRRSRAVWKILAADMPIGLVVPDGPAHRGRRQRRPGRAARAASSRSPAARRDQAPRRPQRRVDHRRRALHRRPPLRPGRAAFTDFDPFWEFVAGPINAGTFGPNALDPTFGPSADVRRGGATPTSHRPTAGSTTASSMRPPEDSTCS